MTKEELTELIVTADDQTDINELLKNALRDTGYPELYEKTRIVTGGWMKTHATRLAVAHYIRGWLRRDETVRPIREKG